MTNDERVVCALEQECDQQEMGLEARLDDIERIGREGPDYSNQDRDLVKQVFFIVATKIHLRGCRAKLANQEKDPNR